jgi:hypothetical protein
MSRKMTKNLENRLNSGIIEIQLILITHFRESIYLGDTALSKRSVEKLVKSLGEEYRGDSYHLITKNCNHFAAHLSKELTGTEIPSWVNRLASLSGSIPFLQKWIPLEWLTVRILIIFKLKF